MTELARGDTAPNFRLRDQDGTWVDLADFAPGKVILYFYPAALTPGCTVEAIDFSATRDTFREAGYAIIGVSPDPPDKLAKFVDRHNLQLILLSDPDLSVIRAYGAWGDRPLWGKVFTGVIRSTFVLSLDSTGRAAVLQAQYAVRATGHVSRLRTSLSV